MNTLNKYLTILTICLLFPANGRATSPSSSNPNLGSGANTPQTDLNLAYSLITLNSEDPKHGTHFMNSRIESVLEEPTAFFGSPEEWAGKPPSAGQEFIKKVVDTGGFVLAADFGPLIGLKGLVVVCREVGQKVHHKAHISHVYVPKDVRGYGLGRQLVTQAIERAHPAVTHLYLKVNANNTKAQELYKSLGFEEFGRDPWASYISGTYHSWMFMALERKAKTL